MGQTVKIKIRAFPYYVDAEDPVTGKKVRQERVAMRGDEVELSDSDLRRAQHHNAIEDGSEQSGDGGGELDVATADVQSVAAWIEEDKPSVSDVVNAADGDAATASKLLEAEGVATGGEPRKGVEEGLNKIIQDGQGS